MYAYLKIFNLLFVPANHRGPNIFLGDRKAPISVCSSIKQNLYKPKITKVRIHEKRKKKFPKF